METVFKLTKTAASVKNIIIEFKLQNEPLLKVFVNTFNNSPYLNWQDVRDWMKENQFSYSKDANGFRQYIQEKMIPIVESKAALSAIQSFIGVSCDWERTQSWSEESKKAIREQLEASNFIFDLDIDREAETLLNDPNPEIQKALSFYPNDKTAAKLRLITLFNTKKSEVFSSWITKTGKYNPEFRFLILLPILDFSPNTKKTPTLDFWENVVDAIYDSYKQNPDQSTKMLKVYKKTFEKIIKEKYHYINFQKGLNNGRWLFIPSKTKSDKSPKQYGTFEDNKSLLMHYGNINRWCVGRDNTATNYLTQGDFFLYLDEMDAARVAIRFVGDTIYEIRGEGNDDANLMPFWREVVFFMESQSFEDKADRAAIYPTLKSVHHIDTLMENGEREKALEEIIKNPRRFSTLSREYKNMIRDDVENTIAAGILENPLKTLYKEDDNYYNESFPPEEILIMPKVRDALLSIRNRANPYERIKIYFLFNTHNDSWKDGSILDGLREVKADWQEDNTKSWIHMLSNSGQFLVADEAGDWIRPPAGFFLKMQEDNKLDQCIDSYLNEDNPNMSYEGLYRFWRNIPTSFRTEKRQNLYNKIFDEQEVKLWANQIRITHRLYEGIHDNEIPSHFVENEIIRKEALNVIANTEDLWDFGHRIYGYTEEALLRYPDTEKAIKEKLISLWSKAVIDGKSDNSNRTTPSYVVENPSFIQSVVEVLSGQRGNAAQESLSQSALYDSTFKDWCDNVTFFKHVKSMLPNLLKKAINKNMQSNHPRDSISNIKRYIRSRMIKEVGLEHYLQTALYNVTLDFIDKELPNPASQYIWSLSEYLPKNVLKNQQIRELLAKAAIKFLKNAAEGNTTMTSTSDIDNAILRVFNSIPDVVNNPEIHQYTSKFTLKRELSTLKGLLTMHQLSTEMEPALLQNKEYYDIVVAKISEFIGEAINKSHLLPLEENEELNKILKSNLKLYGKYIITKRQLDESERKSMEERAKHIEEQSRLSSFWKQFSVKSINQMQEDFSNLPEHMRSRFYELDQEDDQLVDRIMKNRSKRSLITEIMVSFVLNTRHLEDILYSCSDKLFDRSRKIRSALTNTVMRLIKERSEGLYNYYTDERLSYVTRNFLQYIPDKLAEVPVVKEELKTILVKYFKSYLSDFSTRWDLEEEMSYHLGVDDERRKNIFNRFRELVLSDPDIQKTISERMEKNISNKNVFKVSRLPEKIKTKKTREKIKHYMGESLQKYIDMSEKGEDTYDYFYGVYFENPDTIPVFVKNDPKFQEILAKFIAFQISSGRFTSASQLTQKILRNDTLRGYITDAYKTILKSSVNPDIGVSPVMIIKHMRRKKKPGFINKFIRDLLETEIQNLSPEEKVEFLNAIGSDEYDPKLLKGREQKKYINDEWQKSWHTHLISSPVSFPDAPKAVQDYIMSDNTRKEEYFLALSSHISYHNLHRFKNMAGFLKHPLVQEKVERDIVPRVVSSLDNNDIYFPDIRAFMLSDNPAVSNAITEQILKDYTHKRVLHNWNTLPPLVKSDPRIQSIIQQWTTQAGNWYTIIKTASVFKNYILL